ncbi:DUF6124 family protein [Pseudomonas sp. RGM2987]|uniref:DUF6124 family protein n=1 Tax=Pseudomonas sp. RGM2987 TaxID=2930090 RepID=UPI001FD66EE9|nr:DUF6124 family protein [Pseudomonas sp. RGM2987]
MNSHKPSRPQQLGTASVSTVDVSERPNITGRPDPVSNVFTIVANVDTEALLCHASENLASLSVMASDLADQLDGPRRNVALAMHQLTVLCELLVNRALDDLDPPQKVPDASISNQR